MLRKLRLRQKKWFSYEQKLVGVLSDKFYIPLLFWDIGTKFWREILKLGGFPEVCKKIDKKTIFLTYFGPLKAN